jgi:hypothetical protein
LILRHVGAELQARLSDIADEVAEDGLTIEL